jgi:hypothetical protein
MLTVAQPYFQRHDFRGDVILHAAFPHPLLKRPRSQDFFVDVFGLPFAGYAKLCQQTIIGDASRGTHSVRVTG